MTIATDECSLKMYSVARIFPINRIMSILTVAFYIYMDILPTVHTRKCRPMDVYELLNLAVSQIYGIDSEAQILSRLLNYLYLNNLFSYASVGLHVEHASSNYPFETSISPNETSYPPNKTSYPQNETSISPNKTSYPPNETFYSPNETFVFPK